MASRTRQVEVTVRDGTRLVATESYEVTATDGVVASGEGDLTASEANHLFPLTVTVANIKSVIVTADQDMTVKTNSSGSPAETLSVGPTKPIIWTTGMAQANPFATNLTALYVTCGATAGTITYEFVSST